MNIKICHAIDIELLEATYSDHYFISMSIYGRKGVIFSLPFYSYLIDKEGNKTSKFEGYVLYSDTETYASYEWLKSIGLQSIIDSCPAGRVGKLYPLPYKCITTKDAVEKVMRELICKNIVLDLSIKMFL